MITLLHPPECGSEFLARFKRLGFPSHPFSKGGVAELTAQSAEAVYFVPITSIGAATWPRLRVKLAEANRLYIAGIENVCTADVARCLRDGAHDVLATEDTDARWRDAIMNAATNQKLWIQLYGGRPLSADDVLVGRSESIQRLRQTIDRLGPTDVCVLVQGESGVGKERVASALHKAGHGKHFVALNCAAIPKDLLEAELFGVEKGAFTGALKARPGLVEQANGGTLFLDEIGEMEMAVQPKLLRFLETRRARRVGGEHEYSVKARVISATNRVLDTEIAERRFRADLYYRLAEIILHAPPLRTRPEDVPELSLVFLRKANERFGKNFESIEPALIEKFQRHAWPGNVRELKSTIDRLVLLFDGPMLREPWWELPEVRGTDHPLSSGAAIEAKEPLPSVPAAAPAAPQVAVPAFAPGSAFPNTKQKLAMARKLMEESDNNYSWVAGQLGINTSTLWRWRKAGKLA
jgi:transcriptional regulator with PAS, ATPase and Fis domain